MLAFQRGRYCARIAVTLADRQAAQRLRARAFRGAEGPDEGSDDGPDGVLDEDTFDQDSVHVLVEDQRSGQVVCSYRMMHLGSGAEVERSYSAQFYELSALETFSGPMVEMGRFCMHPHCHDADILRVAWGAMTAYVDEAGIEMLFGCSSFHGTAPQRYGDAFALLRERHLAPVRWRPGVKAPEVFNFADEVGRQPDSRSAQLQMPPLLRTYLVMGGWVSDHAVIDSDLGTLHVFTGLEVRTVPPARARLLRAMAG